MTNLTLTDPCDGTADNDSKKQTRQQCCNATNQQGGSDAESVTMVSGLEESNMCCVQLQEPIDRCLKARKASVVLIGLVKGTKQEFKEPEEPAPAKEADPVSKEQHQ